LVAIGLSKEMAKGSLRLTIGSRTSEEDIKYVVGKVKEAVSR